MGYDMTANQVGESVVSDAGCISPLSDKLSNDFGVGGEGLVFRVGVSTCPPMAMPMVLGNSNSTTAMSTSNLESCFDTGGGRHAQAVGRSSYMPLLFPGSVAGAVDAGSVADPARPPSPDFSIYNDEERKQILDVLRRQQEESRKDLRYMRTDLRDKAISTSRTLAHARAQPYASPQSAGVCQRCSEEVLRSCSRWARNKSQTPHTCELRRRHQALTGSWYNGVDVITANDALSHLILKVQQAELGDNDIPFSHGNGTTTSQEPSTSFVSHSLAYHESKPGSHDSPRGSADSASSMDIFSIVPYSQLTVPGRSRTGSGHGDSLSTDSPSPDLSSVSCTPSPRTSFDSGIVSLESSSATAASMSILRRGSASPGGRNSPPRVPRRVSFSQALEQVQTFNPSDRMDLPLIQIVTELQSETAESGDRQEKDAKLTTSLSSTTSATKKMSSPMPEMERASKQAMAAGQRKSVTPLSDVAQRGPQRASLPQLNTDIDGRSKIGSIQISFQRSCLLDQQVHLQVNVAQGSDLVLDSTAFVLPSNKAGTKPTPPSSHGAQFHIKCFLINSAGQQKNKFFRVQTRRQYLPAMTGKPEVSDQFIATVKQSELDKCIVLRVCVLQRRSVGLLRRPVTTVFGTVDLSIRDTLDGQVSTGVYELVAASDMPYCETPPPQRDHQRIATSVTPPPTLIHSTSTAAKANSLRRQLSQQSRTPAEGSAPSKLQRSSSTEDLPSIQATVPIRRFGSFETLQDIA